VGRSKEVSNPAKKTKFLTAIKNEEHGGRLWRPDARPKPRCWSGRELGHEKIEFILSSPISFHFPTNSS